GLMFYRRSRRFRWMQPYPPAWWPANEPWPPRSGLHLYDRRPRRAFRGTAFGGMWAVIWLVMILFWLADGRHRISWGTESPGAMALFIAGTAVAILFLVLAGRIAGRMGAVMEAADRVAGGDYDVHVREIGPQSVRALARSFNTMTARLKDHDRLRRDLM